MKIAINGMGIAGSTLAYWLRRSGHDPVLFEKAPAVRTGGYLIDFWGLGYDIAERMGILGTLRERGYEMQCLRMVDADGRRQAELELAPLFESQHGRFISLARADLAATLVDACRGIPMHFGVSICAVTPDGTGVSVMRSDGEHDQFDLVVGADGLHSAVRALAFGPQARFERSLACRVAAFRVRGYPHRDELTYVSHTVRGRHAARVSLRDDETVVMLVCLAEFVSEEHGRTDDARAVLRCAYADMGWEVPELLAAMEGADDVYFDRVSQIHMPHWQAGRVALVGDAAACPSLLAGEGAGLGMLEAYVLAGELHRAEGDCVRALARYESRLRTFVSAKQKAALRFRGFIVPKTTLGLAVRHVATRAFSHPWLAKPFWERSLHDAFQLPEYPMG